MVAVDEDADGLHPRGAECRRDRQLDDGERRSSAGTAAAQRADLRQPDRRDQKGNGRETGMNLADVAERLGKSKRTVMRWVDDGRFPSPAIRSGRLVTWTDSAVERWCTKHRYMNGGRVLYVTPPRPRRHARKRMAKDARADD